MDEESVVESLNVNKSFKYFGSDLGSALYSSHPLAQIKLKEVIFELSDSPIHPFQRLGYLC